MADGLRRRKGKTINHEGHEGRTKEKRGRSLVNTGEGARQPSCAKAAQSGGSRAVIPAGEGACAPQSLWDWDWDWDWDWVRVWVTLGRPLGHPRVTQGSRADHASVEWKKWLCLQQKVEKAGWGERSPGSERQKSHRGGAETRRGRWNFVNLDPSLPTLPLVQDDRLRRAANFHPAKPTAGSSGTPVYAARLIFLAADLR
jgi:hypothetical protein